MKFINANQLLNIPCYLQLCQRNFGLSHISNKRIREHLKEKLRPINFSDDKVFNKEQEYLSRLKSKKGLSAAALATVPKELEFSVAGIKDYISTVKQRFLIFDQRYIDKRVEILGYDLAAAHFIVHRGGKVRFKGQKEWIERNDEFEYELPRKFSPHYLVEELDLSKLPIILDGFLNLENLIHLKSLKLVHCPNVNDWCIDWLCGNYCEFLEHLDISYCPSITSAGLAAIARLRNLQSLNVTGLEKISNLKLICLLLEDAIPNLKVEGISFEENFLEEKP